MKLSDLPESLVKKEQTEDGASQAGRHGRRVCVDDFRRRIGIATATRTIPDDMFPAIMRDLNLIDAARRHCR